MTGRCKFDELRGKTDRELIHLASSELDLGLRDAQEALESAENWAFAELHYRMAERAYKQALRLIRLAGDASDEELGAVASRLGQLREALDALSAIGSEPTRAEVATLARALWKARGCPEGLPEQDWFRAERTLKSHAVCVGN
ncbi:MAG TPA: DUF2934 domain-containing protein [Bryobacteraceae bacterium]|jgi:hypothetical protein